VNAKAIGDGQGEAAFCGNLGHLHERLDLDEYCKAKEYQKKALVITQQIGDRRAVRLQVMEAWELCIILSVNMAKLKNIK